MRGQAFTLEAVTASILLIGGLLFALQVTAVTPLSASTSSQHIENQQEATAEGVLAAAAEHGDLKVAALNWDSANEQFYGVSGEESYYVSSAPTNRFGDLLSRSFAPRGIVFNVYVRHDLASGGTGRQRMVYRGEPSDNAVSASVTVVLFDDDVLYDDAQEPTTNGLSDIGTSFYASDVYPSSEVYNVVEVQIVAWRQ